MFTLNDAVGAWKTFLCLASPYTVFADRSTQIESKDFHSFESIQHVETKTNRSANPSIVCVLAIPTVVDNIQANWIY